VAHLADPETQDVFQIRKTVEKKESRVIGVITKCDRKQRSAENWVSRIILEDRCQDIVLSKHRSSTLSGTSVVNRTHISSIKAGLVCEIAFLVNARQAMRSGTKQKLGFSARSLEGFGSTFQIGD
jgi:hypothetical protein